MESGGGDQSEGIDYLTSNSIQGTSTGTAYIRLQITTEPPGAADVMSQWSNRFNTYSCPVAGPVHLK